MLTGERARNISQNHIGGGYIVRMPRDGKIVQLRYCGLLDALCDACFPDYDYKDAKAIAAIPVELRQSTGLARPWHGISRGRVVHNQVRAFVNSGGMAALGGMYKNTLGKARHKDEEVSLAASFLDSLAEVNLTPIRSEFSMYYEYLSLASSVDLLCRHTDPRSGRVSLSLVEIKCGYDNSFKDGTGPLTAPESLRGLYNNSPYTQAFLQLAFYRQMVRHHFPHIPIGPCYVAQIRHSDTLYHLLPDDIIRGSAELLAAVGHVRLSQLQQQQQQSAHSTRKRTKRRRAFN